MIIIPMKRNRFNASNSNAQKFKWNGSHNLKLSEESGCADKVAVGNKKLQLLRTMVIT
jgi:hypothetical protein